MAVDKGQVFNDAADDAAIASATASGDAADTAAAAANSRITGIDNQENSSYLHAQATTAFTDPVDSVEYAKGAKGWAQDAAAASVNASVSMSAFESYVASSDVLDDLTTSYTAPTRLVLSGGNIRRSVQGVISAADFGLAPSASAAANTTAIQNAMTVAVAFANTTGDTARVLIPASASGAAFPINPVTVTGSGSERLVVRCEGSLTSAVANPGTFAGLLSFASLASLTVHEPDVTYTGDYDPGTLDGELACIAVTDCENVTLYSPRARGANKFGVYITGATNATVVAGDCQANRQAGLLIVDSDSVNILGGQFHENGLSGDTGTGYGVALPVSTPGNEARSVIITGAQANDNFRKGFDLHSGRNLILSSFQARRNLVMGVFALNTLSGSYASRIKITDGQVEGVGSAHPIEATGVYCGGVSGTLGDSIEISNVSIENHGDYGFRFLTGGIRHIRLTDCLVDGIAARTGQAVSQGYTFTTDGDPELIELTNCSCHNARIGMQIPKAQVVRLTGCTLPIQADAPHLDGVGSWAATTAYSEGDRVRGVSKLYGFYYECTTAGTSGGTEPTWATTQGGTVSDGTAVWTTVGIAPYDGFVLGNAGAGLGLDLLQMTDCMVEEGFERNHRTAANVDRLSLLNNFRGSQGYNMDPPPITLTAPYQSVTGSSSTTLEMLTLPTQSYVRVVGAGGRQLSATRKLEVHVGGSARHTVTDTTWHEVHAEGHYSGSIVTVQLVLVNDGATVDMGGSVQVVVTRGLNL